MKLGCKVKGWPSLRGEGEAKIISYGTSLFGFKSWLSY